MSYPRFYITGPTQSGTTFIVVLLYRLGIDTGFNRKHVDYCTGNNIGGLEFMAHPNTRRRSYEGDYPIVVKAPIGTAVFLKETTHDPAIKQAKDQGWWDALEHVFVTSRDAGVNATARVERVGGSFSATFSSAYEYNLAFNAFIVDYLDTVLKGKPHTKLEFPRLVEDAEYTFNNLKPMLEGIDYATFKRAFDRLSDVELVHYR